MADIYVLDSNVLLTDPQAIFKFPGAEVVIPTVVIEEIDGKKQGCDGTAYNARQVARHLDSLRQHGSLHQPTPLGNGGMLRVELNHRSLDLLRDHFSEVNNDNRLLAVALNLQLEENGKEQPGIVTIVSQDAIVRIKADALGLPTREYPHEGPAPILYAGYEEMVIDPGLVDRFYFDRELSAAELDASLQPNQYVILKSPGSSQSGPRTLQRRKRPRPASALRMQPGLGIIPRNVQQKMAWTCSSTRRFP